MSCRFLLRAFLLTAIAVLPTRSLACESCCHDSTSLADRLRYQITPILYYRDTPYQAGPTGGGGKAAVGGFGLQLRGPIASKSRWDWFLEGGYGRGDVKTTTTTSTTSTTFETKLSQYHGRIGADYRRGRGFYCGPGFEYVSTKATLKDTGFPDEKFNPFRLYGFEAHLGGNIRLTHRASLFGETSDFIGRGTFDNTSGTLKTETRGLYSMASWEGGLVYRF